MNYSKVDAALATALDENESVQALDVFIRLSTPVVPEDSLKLERFGIRATRAGQRLLTARLSPKQIAELTDQGWVRYLRLAETLELMDP
jgi:hypothetical protein